MRILLSAFACDPTKGSEHSNGWSWATGLSNQGFDVHCLTRITNKQSIEQNILSSAITFHYIKLPLGLENLYSRSQATMYLYYMIWQYIAFLKAKRLHRRFKFSLAHHVSWGSIQQGSFLYKLPIPFVFGPTGGGQKAPEKFKKYFVGSWKSEIKREKISDFFVRFNPACKNMIRKASAIWVSNSDTAALVRSIGGKNVYTTLDAALPIHFFPASFSPKILQHQRLNLLWIGRFLPRKGSLLLLDVMQQLRNYPEITLTVVGDGEQREKFLEELENKELQNSVFWKGQVSYEEVKLYYATHDVFFFTSLRDSCPAQLIEAMAYGLPIITLNLHGQSVIVNDQTGFRCNCDSPEVAIEELKRAILKLYHNSTLVTKMSIAAQAFARQQIWESKIKTIIEQSYPK